MSGSEGDSGLGLEDLELEDLDLDHDPALQQQLQQLFRACEDGDVAAARSLLAAAPQLAVVVDTTHEQAWDDMGRPDGQTALHAAVQYGRVPIVELLLQAGAAPMAVRRWCVDVDGMTPLHWAASTYRAKANDADAAAMARMLLAAAPAAALVPDYDGGLPLHDAVSSRRPAVVRLLLAAAPEAALHADRIGRRPIDAALARLADPQATAEQHSRALEVARCLFQVVSAPVVLAALARPSYARVQHERLWYERLQPLYADLAARLAAGQWAEVPEHCAGLLQALPAVLARSQAEAAQLVARLPAGERQRLCAAVLALGCASRRLSVPLPAPLFERLLCTGLRAE